MAFLALLALGLALTRDAQAFDCARATSTTEKAICGSPRLRELDARLVEKFRKLRTQPGGAPAYEQLRWLKARDSRCVSNEACLEEMYSIRLTRLGGSGPVVKVTGRWRPTRELFPVIPFEGTTFWGEDSHSIRHRSILITPERLDFGGTDCAEARLQTAGTFPASRLIAVGKGGFGFHGREFPGVRLDDPVTLIRFDCHDSRKRGFAYEGSLLWIESASRLYFYTAGSLVELGREKG